MYGVNIPISHKINVIERKAIASRLTSLILLIKKQNIFITNQYHKKQEHCNPMERIPKRITMPLLI